MIELGGFPVAADHGRRGRDRAGVRDPAVWSRRITTDAACSVSRRRASALPAAQIAPTAGRTQVAPIEELGIGGRRRHGAEVVGDLGWTAALPARTAAADR